MEQPNEKTEIKRADIFEQSPEIIIPLHHKLSSLSELFGFIELSEEDDPLRHVDSHFWFRQTGARGFHSAGMGFPRDLNKAVAEQLTPVYQDFIADIRANGADSVFMRELECETVDTTRSQQNRALVVLRFVSYPLWAALANDFFPGRSYPLLECLHSVMECQVLVRVIKKIIFNANLEPVLRLSALSVFALYLRIHLCRVYPLYIVDPSEETTTPPFRICLSTDEPVESEAESKARPRIKIIGEDGVTSLEKEMEEQEGLMRKAHIPPPDLSVTKQCTTIVQRHLLGGEGVDGYTKLQRIVSSLLHSSAGRDGRVVGSCALFFSMCVLKRDSPNPVLTAAEAVVSHSREDLSPTFFIGTKNPLSALGKALSFQTNPNYRYMKVHSQPSDCWIQRCSLPSCQENAFLLCGACFLTPYCCQEHQSQHWKSSHRHECIARANRAATFTRANDEPARSLMKHGLIQSLMKKRRDLQEKGLAKKERQNTVYSVVVNHATNEDYTGLKDHSFDLEPQQTVHMFRSAKKLAVSGTGRSRENGVLGMFHLLHYHFHKDSYHIDVLRKQMILEYGVDPVACANRRGLSFHSHVLDPQMFQGGALARHFPSGTGQIIGKIGGSPLSSVHDFTSSPSHDRKNNRVWSSRRDIRFLYFNETPQENNLDGTYQSGSFPIQVTLRPQWQGCWDGFAG